jgi:hypothetical protein
MTGGNQEIFVFRGLGQRELQTLSNPEGVPSLGLNTVVLKDPLVPISPTHYWGQRPVLEGILPQGRLSSSRFEGDSLGFGYDEFAGIRNSHRTKEIRR